METLMNDVRYAIRTLSKAPAFSVIAILILALGIGASTSIFSVVNAVLLRPLPFREPGRLVSITRVIQQKGTTRTSPTVSLTEVENYRQETRSLESIGSFVFTQLPLKVGDQSFSIVTAAADPELLRTIGVSPVMGRNFSGGGSAQPDLSAIITHKLWVAAFNSDPAAVGKSVTVDGELYTVIGVLPGTFQIPRSDASYFTEDVDLLIPVANIAKSWGKDSPQWFAIGRLASGMALPQADAELRNIASHLPQDHAFSVRLSPLNEETTRKVRPALLMILGISIVLLLIACTNIMNLLFSRSAVRGREMAIRKAVGASTGRLARQMLTECACLTLISGALGVALARLVLDALVGISPFHLPVSGKINIDPSVLVFALIICTLAALVAGFLPALHAGRQREDLLGGSGTRASGGRVVAQVQRALTVIQVALGLGLLTSAGLLVHSLWRLSSVDPGFRTEGVLGFALAVPSDHQWQQRAQLYQRMLDATRDIPGVQSVGWITNLPPESRKGVFAPFTLVGDPAVQDSTNRKVCNTQIASEDYFQTVGVPVLQGRGITPGDGTGTLPIAIVNEALVLRYFPNGNILGQKITTIFDRTPREIVGVVKPGHDRGLDASSFPTVYLPLKQATLPYGSIVVRAQIPTQSLIREIRTRFGRIDASIPISGFQTLDQRIHESLGEPRFYTFMAAACALMAVLFVTLGLYGVIAYSVSRRTAEIGIRMALGAQRGAILRMVLLQGLGLAGLGTAIGLVISIFVSRIFTSLLFEIKPNDPVTFIFAAALVICVTLLASYFPARRASRVDPIISLRYE